MMDIEPGRCRRTDGKKWRCHQSVVPNEKYCEKHMHRGSKRSRKLVEASLYTVVKSDENEKPKNQSQRELDAKDRTAVMNLASELVFSPKMVLHDGMGYPKSETLKTTSESKSRCHKTDGNICWCKKELVPDYKFFAQHHSRRKICTKKPSPSPSASRGVRVSYACTPGAKSSRMQEGEVGLCLAVGSNMKVSLPSMMADPKNVIKDNVGVVPDGGSSSSSEATETDEEISGVWDVVALSP